MAKKTTSSKRFHLSAKDFEVWAHNVLVWLAPLGVIYFGAIAATLQTEHHIFSLRDFAPSNFTLGAMVLYIVDRFFDLSRKFVGGK